MIKVITPEIREVMEALHYRPAVSIILPFESKLNLKTELTHSLKTAADRVEKELQTNYSAELVRLVMSKLRAIISDLKVDSHKKSIAVYVSPVFEKVLYLDIAVEEKIIIDESFEIRDLVYSKKQLHSYLLLILSGKKSKIFLGNSGELVRLVSTLPESIDAYVNEHPEKVANFSDTTNRKELLIDKFLQQMDHSLDVILNEYHLPVFVLGTERILGHFKKITRHTESLIEFVKGNYEERTPGQLKEVLLPHIEKWGKAKQNYLLRQLDEAAGKKKLAIGIKDVWAEVNNHKGRLLLVEKDYMYAAQHGVDKEVIYEMTALSNNFSNIRDAVDDVMEKVLADGGDVEFVDKGVLKQYGHIALVQYY